MKSHEEKYEVSMALVMAIAAIGSIGTCSVTSALNEGQYIDTTVETVVSSDVSTETTVVTSTTTPMTTTTTSTTATIESTYVVEIEVDEGLYETKVVHSGEMINWSGVTTRPVTTSTTTTTATTSTTTTTITMTTTTETMTELSAVEVDNRINIDDADYILLCNCVAHEAGATYIPASEKAKVVEVIMNRVNSGSFPNTIYDVITQRSQFSGASGYANLGCYSSQVDDLVKEGVDLYLSDPSSYQHGYLYFHGDGRQNYFK